MSAIHLHRVSCLIALLVASTGCTPKSEPITSLATHVDSLADAYFDATLQLNPELYTGYGIAGADHSRIRDNSLAGVQTVQARMDTLRQAAATIDASSLDRAEATSAEIWSRV